MKIKVTKLTPQQEAKILGDPKLTRSQKLDIVWLLNQPRPTLLELKTDKLRRKREAAMTKRLLNAGVPIETEIIDSRGRVQERRFSLRSARGFLATLSVKIGIPASNRPAGS